MTIADLHAWAMSQEDAADRALRGVGALILTVLTERAELMTTEYRTLREDLRRALYDVAKLKRELACLRSERDASAAWEVSQ